MAVASPKKKSRKGVTASGNLTNAAIAAGLDVSINTLSNYVARGCPRTSIEAAAAWRAENIKSYVTDDSADDDETDGTSTPEARRRLLIQQERRESALADRYELENQVRRGELIEREDVERDLSIAASRLLNRLNTLPTRHANLCPTELKVPAKEMAENLVRTIIREIQEDLRLPTNG